MSDARQTPGFGTRDSGLGARESSSTTPVDLDAAIDIVAREMTAFEPSGALRARVLERIGEHRRHTMPAVPRWAWAGAVAAVALAVATTFWVTSPVPTSKAPQLTVAGNRTGGPSPAVPATGKPAVHSAGVPAAASIQAGAGPTAAPTGRAAEVRRSRPAVVDVPADGHPVPALAEIEPLRFSAVEPDPLQIAAVEVAPLRASPTIDIPSLDQGSTDSQSTDTKKEK